MQMANNKKFPLVLFGWMAIQMNAHVCAPQLHTQNIHTSAAAAGSRSVYNARSHFASRAHENIKTLPKMTEYMVRCTNKHQHNTTESTTKLAPPTISVHQPTLSAQPFCVLPMLNWVRFYSCGVWCGRIYRVTCLRNQWERGGGSSNVVDVVKRRRRVNMSQQKRQQPKTFCRSASPKTHK